MFLAEWTALLMSLLVAGWGIQSRPGRLRAHRGERDRALEAWAALAARHQLSVAPVQGAAGTTMTGVMDRRALSVSVRTGGGWGAEREYVTRIALQPCCPLPPGLAIWRAGRQAPVPGGTRLPGRRLMATGDPAPVDLALPRVEAEMAARPALHLCGGWLVEEVWGIPADIAARLDAVATLAGRLEGAVCAPWLKQADALGLRVTVQDATISMRGDRPWGHVSVLVAPSATRIRCHRPLPGVRQISRRKVGEAAAAVGNPITDRFLRVEASAAVRARLRGAEATALAMEVVYAGEAGRVSEEGVAVTLPAREPLAAWLSRCEALAALLAGEKPTPASNHSAGGGV